MRIGSQAAISASGIFFADESHCEAGPQSFAVDLDCQFAKYNRANDKGHLDHCID